jgi:hypothetical protein
VKAAATKKIDLIVMGAGPWRACGPDGPEPCAGGLAPDPLRARRQALWERLSANNASPSVRFMIASKGNATARCRALVILSAREGPAAYAGREVARRSGRARFGDATVRGIARRACCAPDAVPLTRHQIVEVVLTEAQLACLKAAVTIGSEESAALGRAVGRQVHTSDRESIALRG